MAAIELHYASAALSRMTTLWVALPDTWGAAPLPVVYLLHGLSDDASAWMRRTSLERYAAERGLMVVMPDGGRGWYTNARQPETDRYEDHVLEVVERIDGLFATVAERGGRGIGGLSMGGYGAIKIALKHPDRFATAHSHSGALDVRPGNELWNDEKSLIFGDELAQDEDCFALAERADRRPALCIDCGMDDYLIEHNRRFAAHLSRLGYEHEYQEPPGAHDWAYWDRWIPCALDFHRRHLVAAGHLAD